jgi:hypothetical protein
LGGILLPALGEIVLSQRQLVIFLEDVSCHVRRDRRELRDFRRKALDLGYVQVPEDLAGHIVPQKYQQDCGLADTCQARSV